MNFTRSLNFSIRNVIQNFISGGNQGGNPNQGPNNQNPGFLNWMSQGPGGQQNQDGPQWSRNSNQPPSDKAFLKYD